MNKAQKSDFFGGLLAETIGADFISRLLTYMNEFHWSVQKESVAGLASLERTVEQEAFIIQD